MTDFGGTIPRHAALKYIPALLEPKMKLWSPHPTAIRYQR
jgi:hypothetical protein